MATAKAGAAKKAKRVIEAEGIAHVNATFNNTLITITDMHGNAIAWASSGKAQFKGSKKSTPFAATVAAALCAKEAKDLGVRRLAWVPLADISPALLQAIVLSEDRRFWEHSGVDWGAAARSVWANLWNTRTRGASTLTISFQISSSRKCPRRDSPPGSRKLKSRTRAWDSIPHHGQSSNSL